MGLSITRTTQQIVQQHFPSSNIFHCLLHITAEGNFYLPILKIRRRYHAIRTDSRPL